MKHKHLKKCLDGIHLKTIRRIAEDLRKSGAIAGIGVVGLVLSADNVSKDEAWILIGLGLSLWFIGLLNDYLADKIEQKSKHKTTHRK